MSLNKFILITVSVLFSNLALADKSIQIGDQTGYVKNIKINEDDLLHVCDLEAFRVGFSYTYMAMWNSHIEHYLKDNNNEDEKKYYLSNIFYSEPNIKASLSGNPKVTNGYSSCKSDSYQQGKMNGFIYEIEDIRSIKESAAKQSPNI
jgi:hypothetical protein